MKRTIKQQRQEQNHKPGSVRHAEKRRVGTCAFADRIAAVSLETYRAVVPSDHREHDGERACVSTIVVHDSHDDSLQVVGLGVGTKFLSESILRSEERDAETNSGRSNSFYGKRLRDCHAEVLARRAFRRFLYLNIWHDLQLRRRVQLPPFSCGKDDESGRASERSSHSTTVVGGNGRLEGAQKDEDGDDRSRSRTLLTKPILTGVEVDATLSSHSRSMMRQEQRRHYYALRDGITLHMYASSAPCGNATLKRFAKMKKEQFDRTLKPNEWPPVSKLHGKLNAHAIRQGQLALLVKLDRMSPSSSSSCTWSSAAANECWTPKKLPLGSGDPGTNAGFGSDTTRHTKHNLWPAAMNDDWCPPGTSVVGLDRGSIHTCSDKICRWNCLGLQGALLASFLCCHPPPSSSVLSPATIQQQPLFMSTLTVGRKMTSVICRRAVCCRAWGFHMPPLSTTEPISLTEKRATRKSLDGVPVQEVHVHNKGSYKCLSGETVSPSARADQEKRAESDRENSCDGTSASNYTAYKLNHPSLMGTGVYMDEAGALDMTCTTTTGNDVRFHSDLCWAWWPGLCCDYNDTCNSRHNPRSGEKISQENRNCKITSPRGITNATTAEITSARGTTNTMTDTVYACDEEAEYNCMADRPALQCCVITSDNLETAECIDGASGLIATEGELRADATRREFSERVMCPRTAKTTGGGESIFRGLDEYDNAEKKSTRTTKKPSDRVSLVSTHSLLCLHFEISDAVDAVQIWRGEEKELLGVDVKKGGCVVQCDGAVDGDRERNDRNYDSPSQLRRRCWTLRDVRRLKRQLSPEYERAKDVLLLRHRVFRNWKRREQQHQHFPISLQGRETTQERKG